MFERVISRFLMKRHYWRHIDFSELSELYASRVLRIAALNMMGIFIAIFMFQNGYSLLFIAVYFMINFFYRACLAVPSAYLIARIGPKHASLISNVLYVPALLFLAALPQLGFPALIFVGLLQGASVSLYTLSYMVNFSKVKHSDHAGKELGYMYMLERLAAALSPVIGGLIALFFGPQTTILVATFLFMFAATPLFFSPEPVQTHQQLTFKFFNWRKVWSNYLSQFAIGADFVASNQLWSLFIAITVFSIGGDVVYAEVGAVMSVTLLVTILSAHVYGKLIDHRRGGELLRVAVIGNIILHLARPFVKTPFNVIAVNVANEAFTTGQNMPFTRGMFDVADSLPGYRIVYITTMEIAAALGASVFFGLLALCVMAVGTVDGMRLSYVLLAPLLLLIPLHGFASLKRRG